ncbi:MAG: family 3 adenylate cyclase [Candidatus Rokubacteria bacterium]|nr:family 3 adenylate cyclase [Candidatus Rokubacteria bacterium]
MAKFSIERFPAGFFDVSQDLAGELPLDLIDDWTHGDRSREAALRLLSAHLVSGAVVSTDAAGLTSLSRRRSVIEILALLDQPKQIVSECGRAIGGDAIGVWAADNTQMLYRGVEPSRVLSALLETRDRIRHDCEVQVGFCVHTGSFFRLGGGLYGNDADRVERLAEVSTRGGEVIVTDTFLKTLGDGTPFAVAERADLPGGDRAWTVTDGPRMAELRAADGRYPYPYSREFFDELRRLRPPIDAAELRRLHERFAQTRTVVLVEHEREEPDVPEIAVLNDLALSAAMTKVGADLLRETGGTEIKTIGNLGIYTFVDPPAAVAFARRFRALFQAQGVAVRIGIDRGEVLVFDLPAGGEDIAGMPVNVASKIAQDTGQFGRVYLTESVAGLAGATGLERLTVRIAGVDATVLVD